MKKYLGLLSIVIGLACAGKSPKLDENVQITPIKEFKDITVKPLETPAAVLTEATKFKPTPTPKPLIQAPKATPKKEKGKPVETPPPVRQPELEDTEGFEGASRRPIVDPFRVGEKVVLNVSYFNVSAGDATLEVRPFVAVNGRKAYHFYSKLTSSSLFNLFYAVDDSCESLVDFDELIPYTFSLSARETKQIRDVRIQFNWEKGQAKFWEQKYTKDAGLEEKEKTWEMKPYAQNVYSAIQYVRIFKLEVGKTYTYRVSDEAKDWEVKAHVLRREKIKTDVGEFDTLVIKPEVSISGVFQPKGEVLFWYTADERHLPVRFESKIAIGTLVGKLKSIEKGAP